jgi:ribosomal protein S18 acetylase RimI-like enzyme
MADFYYEINPALTVDEFVDLLKRSTLAQRRPTDDKSCMESMLHHANLLVAARHENKLIGVARSLTDFHYTCYVSDLAVDESFQRRGVGRELVRITKQQLGSKCRIVLLSAPKAVDYYPKLGFTQHPSAWVLEPGQDVR